MIGSWQVVQFHQDPPVNIMNIETLVIRTNKSLQSLSRKTSRSALASHAMNVLKSIAVSSDSLAIFGSFLKTCPYRYLNKIRFHCEVDSTINGKFFITNVSCAAKWVNDESILDLQSKIEQLNEIFQKLDYTKLSISSNVENTFNFDNLRNIKF